MGAEKKIVLLVDGEDCEILEGAEYVPESVRDSGSKSQIINAIRKDWTTGTNAGPILPMGPDLGWGEGDAGPQRIEFYPRRSS
jgi:hypothetical protein